MKFGDYDKTKRRTSNVPVSGAVVGTGGAMVTADIRHLSVTIVTPITRTLTVKHVTLIVNDCKSGKLKQSTSYSALAGTF